MTASTMGSSCTGGNRRPISWSLRTIAELQSDLDAWIKSFNEVRQHQGRWCFGKTPMQTFLDAKALAQEKMIAA